MRHRRRAGSRARSSDRRRSGRGCPPSPRGSARGSAAASRSSSAVALTIWPGRAEAALERVLGDERLLQRGGAAGREALDRHDLVARGRLGEQQAGVDGPAVDEHRAGAAGALSAGELRPEQLEIVAQDGEQPAARGLHDVALSVDLERDRHASRTTGGCLRTSSGVGSAGAPSAPHPRPRSRPRSRPAAAARRATSAATSTEATTETTTTDTTTAAAADGCTDVAAPAAARGRRRHGAEGAPRPREDLQPRLQDELRLVHGHARPRDGAGDRGVARLAREVGLLRRHDLPPDRPGLRDPGRRPDPVGERRPRLPDGRSASRGRDATRRASSRWRRRGAEPAGTAGSQFFVVTGADVGLPARLRHRRQRHERDRRRRAHRRARRPGDRSSRPVPS